MALVPQELVTVTSTGPAASAGVLAVIKVGESTVKLVAGVEPNLTSVAPMKSVPEMITVAPPLAGPFLGFTRVTAGGGPKARLCSRPDASPSPLRGRGHPGTMELWQLPRTRLPESCYRRVRGFRSLPGRGR